MVSQIQSIYDGLAELANDGEIQKAKDVVVALLDGTAIQEALSSGQTLDQYIASVFSSAGVELEKATAEFAEYANSALETMLEVAPDKALEKTNLEDILTNMLGGESLYDIVNEMAKEQLSSLGEEYVTDENIASVGGAILETLFGDTPEILSLIDANTGQLKEGVEGATQELIDSTKTSLQSLRATIAEEGGFAEQMEGLFGAVDEEDARTGVESVINYLKDLQESSPDIYEGFTSKYGLEGIAGLNIDDLADEDIAYIIN